MKEGGPFSTKCGPEEAMEMELVLAKKLCIGAENFEMVEVVDQPRREQ